MQLETCSYCGARVVMSPVGTCPGCRNSAGQRQDLLKREQQSVIEDEAVEQARAKDLVRTGKWLTVACFTVLIAIPIVGEILFFVWAGYPEWACPLLIVANVALLYRALGGHYWPRIVAAVLHCALAAPVAPALLTGKLTAVELTVWTLPLAFVVVPCLTLLCSRSIQAFAHSQTAMRRGKRIHLKK